MNSFILLIDVEGVDDCSPAAAGRRYTAGRGWARVWTSVARRIQLAAVPTWMLKFGRALRSSQ
jgi:hypothetical protein